MGICWQCSFGDQVQMRKDNSKLEQEQQEARLGLVEQAVVVQMDADEEESTQRTCD